MKDSFVMELESSGGERWREVESKRYDLKEIIDYLQDCIEAPQFDTRVSFTIREGGDLYITTSNEVLDGDIEASGFTER